MSVVDCRWAARLAFVVWFHEAGAAVADEPAAEFWPA